MKHFAAFTLAALTLTAPGTTSAATVLSEWASALSGNWGLDDTWLNTPALGGFPHNGNGGVPTYGALIAATGPDYTIQLNTDITVEDLTLNSVNATVNHTSGTFAATNGMAVSAGTYQLSGGTISNTAINLLGGNFVFTSGGGALSDGAVLNMLVALYNPSL